MTGLHGKERKDVCLLGPGSVALESAFTHRNLELVETSVEVALNQCAGATRAIVVVANPSELAKILERVLRPALENGAAFLAIDTDKSGLAQVQRMCGPQELSRRLGISSTDAELLPARAFATTANWEQAVAQFCAEHDPGRSAASGIEFEDISRERDHTPDPEDESLIRRAFSDCTTVKIEYLPGGQSRAKGPWVVEAQYPDGRSPVRLVVKTGGIRAISEEIRVMEMMCFNHIPFRHYPPVVRDRCVTGATKRAIVSMYVEKATTLEEFILIHPPDAVITDIFDGPLKLWRRGVGRQAVRLGEFYRTRGVIPDEAWKIKDIWAETCKADVSVLRYNQLYDRFIAHAPVDVQQVDAHGDLHLRNIFVHDRTADVLLIDFSKSSQAPASYDPATLDVSLAFDIPEHQAAGAGVSDEERLELYRPPLLAVRPMENPSHRIAAIFALRRKIRDSVSELEYQLAIAGCLIWQAWRRSNVTAYRCASRILAGLGSGGA